MKGNEMDRGHRGGMKSDDVRKETTFLQDMRAGIIQSPVSVVLLWVLGCNVEILNA